LIQPKIPEGNDIDIDNSGEIGYKSQF